MLMMMLLSAMTVAQGDDWEPILPAPPATTSDECPKAFALVPGEPPPLGLVGEDGLVVCRATALPDSWAAHMLLIKAWANQTAPRYRALDLENQALQLELTWNKDRVQQLEDFAAKPTPWLQRPTTQRWAGRLETTVVFIVAAAIVINADLMKVNR